MIAALAEMLLKQKYIRQEAERADREEDALYGSGDLPEKGERSPIRVSDIEAAARALAESDDERKRKAARTLENEAQNLRKYEEQEAKLAGRNSYSKTDPGATFMYTKDGRLAPAYNAQAGTTASSVPETSP